MIAAVDFHALLEVVYASLALGLIVSVAFSVLLYGAVRSIDLRRDGNAAASAAFAVLGALGAAVFVAVVYYGFHVIISK